MRVYGFVENKFYLSCALNWMHSANLVQQRPATRLYSVQPALLRYYRFKVKRISRTWQFEFSLSPILSQSRLSTHAFVPPCSPLSEPTKRPSSPQLTDSDILISPGYRWLTYFPDPIKTASSSEIKSLRHPSVCVSPTFRWRPGWKTFHAPDVNPRADFNAS